MEYESEYESRPRLFASGPDGFPSWACIEDMMPAGSFEPDPAGLAGAIAGIKWNRLERK
jgi:hypothetical protein